MKPENLLEDTRSFQKCTLGCPILDNFLAGGIAVNSITELVAESGSGKTQICLQLLLCAQFHTSHGGLAASSLYIHSEFPFPSRRLHQLSQSFHSSQRSHLFAIKDDACSHIFARGVHHAHQLFDLLSKLDSLLDNPPITGGLPVKLIVIDSIAALFRSEFENTARDLKQRSYLFFKISAILKSLAKKFCLAIVITNQVVDMIDSDGLNGVKIGNLSNLYTSGRRVSPALGLSWANCVNTRLFLSRNERTVNGEESGLLEHNQTTRRIQVVFAPHLPDSSCQFVITREGVFGDGSRSG